MLDLINHVVTLGFVLVNLYHPHQALSKDARDTKFELP